MTAVLIILLAVLWGVVFLPAILRAREKTSPIVSVSSFSHRMALLRRTQSRDYGRWIALARASAGSRPSRRQTLMRRQKVLLWLVLSAGATLVLGLVPAFRGLLRAHLLIDGALCAYVAFLIYAKREPPKGQLGDDSQSTPADHQVASG